MNKMPMTSRARVLAAINHQEPDRVPFDLNLTADAYHSLRDFLGLPPDRDKKVGIWSDISPAEDLLDRMEIDFLYLGLNSASKPSPLARDDGLIYDQWGIGRKKTNLPNGSSYFEMVKHPLAKASLQDVQDYPWPDPFDPARVEGVRERFQTARQHSTRAIVARFATSIWEQATYLCGLQNWLEMIVLQPDIAEAILDKTCEVAMGMAEVGIEAVGDLIDIYRLSGEDLGTQSSTIISMGMYRKFLEPRYKKYWRYVKEKLAARNSNAKLMIHSCGAIRPILPSWIDLGLDILNPIQPLAKGMEPEGLKKDFGQQLTFHGGIDLQFLLPNGTREEVMAEVQRYIRALAPGGGYIVSPAHNVQSDVPPENLVAIRDAVQRFGQYPIQ